MALRTVGLLPDAIDFFMASPQNYLFYVLFASKHEGVIDELIDKAIDEVIGEPCARGIIDCGDTEENILWPEYQLAFMPDGLKWATKSEARELHGTYLYFALPISSTDSDALTLARGKIDNCASLISLIHGRSVAAEKHYEGLFNKLTGESWVKPRLYISPLREKEDRLTQGIAQIISESPDCTFATDETIELLLRTAHQESNRTVCFLMLWLVLEVALGGGGGRKKFACDIMKSERLNEIMKRFHDLRGALLHDGTLVRPDEIQYLMMKIIVLMILVEQQSVKDDLLEYLLKEFTQIE